MLTVRTGQRERARKGERERGREVETPDRLGHMIYSQTNYAKSARSHSHLAHYDFNLINVCDGM